MLSSVCCHLKYMHAPPCRSGGLRQAATSQLPSDWRLPCVFLCRVPFLVWERSREGEPSHLVSLVVWAWSLKWHRCCLSWVSRVSYLCRNQLQRWLPHPTCGAQSAKYLKIMPHIYYFYSTSIYLEFTLTFILLPVTLPSCSGCRRFPTTARGHLSCWWGLRWIWEMTATLWRNWPRTNSEPWRARAERNWLGSSGPSNMWSAQLSHRYTTRSGFRK